MPNARFCEHHHDWAVALNFNVLAPPPQLRHHAILQGKVKKLRISLRIEYKNMKFFGGEALIFMKFFRDKPIFFRGECNFSQSSRVRRKGKSSTRGYGY